MGEVVWGWTLTGGGWMRWLGPAALCRAEDLAGKVSFPLEVHSSGFHRPLMSALDNAACSVRLDRSTDSWRDLTRVSCSAVIMD